MKSSINHWQHAMNDTMMIINNDELKLMIMITTFNFALTQTAYIKLVTLWN